MLFSVVPRLNVIWFTQLAVVVVQISVFFLLQIINFPRHKLVISYATRLCDEWTKIEHSQLNLVWKMKLHEKLIIKGILQPPRIQYHVVNLNLKNSTEEKRREGYGNMEKKLRCQIIVEYNEVLFTWTHEHDNLVSSKSDFMKVTSAPKDFNCFHYDKIPLFVDQKQLTWDITFYIQ